MSIDWAKAEERADKKLSIEGKFLLDLRSKINNLEKQLAQKIKDLDKTSNDLRLTQEKFSDVSKKAQEQTQSLLETQKNFERAREEKLYADAEINKFKSSKAELENKLTEANSKITELEDKLKESSLKAERSEKEKDNILENYELEKSGIKDELQQRKNEIEDLKKELQTTISEKYIEIETLKDERDTQVKEINALKQKIENIEETMHKAKGVPQLIEEIKEIMTHKGFLSDKEFDDLIEKLESS
ncbi:MAG: hypothetical protein ACFFG0_07320 [Candidatus Thorarchaeota archaeon]